MFFFFQAEDGIRDIGVTGVQTCALPIYEDVVRIMSIHKSKGLEFPVVILSGLGKGFNFQDTRKSILFHHELGIGPDYVDLEKRISYPTIIKQIIKKKIKLETLSEEMRILYVAFTRAKEKLILTGMANKLDDSIEKWCNIGEDEGEKLPDYVILEGNSYLQWIMPALTRHKDGCELKKRIAKEKNRYVIDDSNWKINILTKEDLNVENGEESNRLDVLKELETLNNTLNCSDYKDLINSRLDWKYKYIEASNIPAKFSVSELKRRFQILDRENSENLVEKIYLKKPLFLQEVKKFTAAEIGTLTHLVMQHIDINKTCNIGDIKSQINSMIIKEFLTEEQAKVVNPYKILNFFNSGLGSKVKNSNLVKRETPFYIEVYSTDIYKDLPKDIYSKEKILLQGVIDMYFQEGDDLVIVDYKTDYVEDVEKVKMKYAAQLKIGRASCRE